MPRICEFFGVVIYMYYNDHRPAHFHAEYAEREALFAIETLEILEGDLPRRPRAFVIEWASLHPQFRKGVMDRVMFQHIFPLAWLT